MEEKRVELCCHTKMSKLQGLSSVREYIDETIKRGYKQIAITDTDSTQSFQDACFYLSLFYHEKDIKIIYGVELHFKNTKTSPKKYSIYVYVKEQKGLENLYSLVSTAYRNLENDEPVIYKKDLDKYRDGLLYASIGNNSEVYQEIENTQIDAILKYYDFIGIEPNESSKEINKKINKLCSKNCKILIGTSECNFINKEDGKCAEVLNYYKKENNVKKRK